MTDNVEVVERIEKSDRLAFRQATAAELIEVSRASLCREISRRKIFPTKTLRVIPKEELLRYLREEVQLSRRKQRVSRADYKPVPLNAQA